MDVEGEQKVAVVGAGTMGPGLAQVFAAAGHPVSLYSRTAGDARARRCPSSPPTCETFVRHGLLEAGDVPAILARITPRPRWSRRPPGRRLVVESIAEDLERQARRVRRARRVLPGRRHLHQHHLLPGHLSRWCPSGASRPRSSRTGSRRRTSSRSSRSSGASGPSDETVAVVVALLERLGKTPVVMDRFVPGFCVNRLLRSIGREVFFLLDNGYMTAEQLDLAVKASLVPRALVLGFVQRYDFTGLDLSLANLREPRLRGAAARRRAAQPRRARRAGRARRQERPGLLRLLRPRPRGRPVRARRRPHRGVRRGEASSSEQAVARP